MESSLNELSFGTYNESISNSEHEKRVASSNNGKSTYERKLPGIDQQDFVPKKDDFTISSACSDSFSTSYGHGECFTTVRRRQQLFGKLSQNRTDHAPSTIENMTNKNSAIIRFLPRKREKSVFSRKLSTLPGCTSSECSESSMVSKNVNDHSFFSSEAYFRTCSHLQHSEEVPSKNTTVLHGMSCVPNRILTCSNPEEGFKRKSMLSNLSGSTSTSSDSGDSIDDSKNYCDGSISLAPPRISEIPEHKTMKQSCLAPSTSELSKMRRKVLLFEKEKEESQVVVEDILYQRGTDEETIMVTMMFNN